MRTRQDILTVARAEFNQHGLSGARVDAIAEKTRTTKRMIYYYFGSKEGLYSAVLEQAYAGIRAAEATLSLDTLGPEAALRRMIEFTFDYHEDNADFVRLVAVENIHQGQYMARMENIRAVNADVLKTLGEILERGHALGIFRRRAEALDIHLMISGLCFHRVSNRYTFGTAFNVDLSAADNRARHRAMVVDAVVGYLRHPA
ncbi:MAG TPA: TetR family transcriptional regulator [Rhodopila sp.]|uniref:TetR family transcriptional regulator n=1 Tax=Rhodopila sp. TaxID=2480087 RepID=UPI002BD6FF52|nr:TetR family transcriptional regulator [Rhodopila sp.]HVY13934.1 TetR family transcriptional regulator [Rhodopila sp.]